MTLLSPVVFISLRLYNKSTELIRKRRYRNKIRKMVKAKKFAPLTKEQKNTVEEYYRNHSLTSISTNWHRFYSGANKMFSPKYIPEDIFYTLIEPKLNRKAYSEVLADKNLLPVLVNSVKIPETIVGNINGYYVRNGKYLTKEEVLDVLSEFAEFVIKPSIESGGGKGVRLITGIKKNMEWREKIGQILTDYRKDFVVQKKIDQHPGMARFNPTSLNTFRVMTLYQKSGPIMLSTIIRMGRKGSFTDNSTTGGLSCGINSEGMLNHIAYQNNSGDTYLHTDQGHKFSDLDIPNFTKVKSTAIDLHMQVPYCRLISWDLALDKDGDVVLLEMNIKGMDINFHQLNNGPVLSELLENIMID